MANWEVYFDMETNFFYISIGKFFYENPSSENQTSHLNSLDYLAMACETSITFNTDVSSHFTKVS